MLISPAGAPETRQSHDEQHSAHSPVPGQQRSPNGQTVSSWWQTPLPSQLSVVQAFWSSQSRVERQARQPRCASQVVPAVQSASFGTCVHVPEPVQASSVQSTPSEQLALSQHSRQAVPPQQSWPVGQPV